MIARAAAAGQKSVPDAPVFFDGPTVNSLTSCQGSLAWVVMTGGLLLGAWLGMWAFGWPLKPPAGFETYDALPRRLLRLAHIAAIALPVLNLAQAQWLGTAKGADRLARVLLMVGTVALPLSLAGAAFWGPALYSMCIPATAVTAGVGLTAYQMSFRRFQL